MMSPQTDNAIPISLTDEIDLTPVAEASRNWTAWAGALISIAILGAVFWQLRQFEFSLLNHMLPASILFWTLFVLLYLSGPLADWTIFRFLWNIPTRGLLPLLRKQVSNELLLGYLGEVYFYAWARRQVGLPGSPFGAIKDVTILSAVVGNIATIALLAISAPLLVPLFGQLGLGLNGDALILSIGFILATSLGLLIFRRKLFSLHPDQLKVVTLIHLARFVATVGLSGWLWHIALPQVALSWWLVLATWRQVVARLPFLPNKDVAFAALALFLVGSEKEIAALMAVMAALILLAHLITGLLLVAEHIFIKEKKSA